MPFLLEKKVFQCYKNPVTTSRQHNKTFYWNKMACHEPSNHFHCFLSTATFLFVITLYLVLFLVSNIYKLLPCHITLSVHNDSYTGLTACNLQHNFNDLNITQSSICDGTAPKWLHQMVTILKSLPVTNSL